MKISLVLLCYLFLFSITAQTYKYDINTTEYRLNYFSHKEDMKCKDCKYYSFSAKYPDGTDVPLCRMINNCIFSQQMFTKKYMDENEKLAQYHVAFLFKTLKHIDKGSEVKQEAAGATRKYYYKVAIQSVLNIHVTTKTNEVVLDTTINTAGFLQFPSPEEPAYLETPAKLMDYYERNYKMLDYAKLRQQIWPVLEKQVKKIVGPVFEDSEEEIEVPFFSVNTKDPDFQSLADANRKIKVLVELINKSNKENGYVNWHSEQAAKLVDEITPVVNTYLDPKFNEKIIDKKDKSHFMRMMRSNVLLLQILSSDFENAAKSLAELKGLRDKEQQAFGPKKLEKTLETLEPIFYHERAGYPKHKTAFGYYR